MQSKQAVILIGHGGLPSDIPNPLIQELQMLKSQRKAKKIPEPSPREIEVDKMIRTWPRTPKTEPYQFGLEAIGTRLKERLGSIRLQLAYNEFCEPSLEEAIPALVKEGFNKIVIVTTMFTPGGGHSEVEIPEIVESAKKQYPGIELQYAWPFDLNDAADFLFSHLKKSQSIS
jgi:sirohydrochlorin cobaltochelatase